MLEGLIGAGRAPARGVYCGSPLARTAVALQQLGGGCSGTSVHSPV